MRSPYATDAIVQSLVEECTRLIRWHYPEPGERTHEFLQSVRRQMSLWPDRYPTVKQWDAINQITFHGPHTWERRQEGAALCG
jgi:hypothetical protein